MYVYLCSSKSRYMRSFILTCFFFLAGLIFSLPATMAQCAMCKGQLESHGSEATSLAVNHGILYLLSLPFILAGTVGLIIYIHVKRRDQEVMLEE